VSVLFPDESVARDDADGSAWPRCRTGRHREPGWTGRDRGDHPVGVPSSDPGIIDYGARKGDVTDIEHGSSSLGVKDSPQRTVRLSRCESHRLIIRTESGVARVGPTTPKLSSYAERQPAETKSRCS